MDVEPVSIGDLARAAGLTLRTIRWYTEKELLKTSGKTGGGRMLYPADSLKKLLKIQVLSEAGLSLEEIKVIVEEIRQNNTKYKNLTMKLREKIKNQRGKLCIKEKLLKKARLDYDRILDQTAGCDECQSRGPKRDCEGCGNLEMLKTICT